MSARVISGKAKGRKLKLVPGDGTRPVTDRVKQAVFNILDDIVEESAWLDLFAGTGSVGIEALSRGAARVVFLDSSGPAIQTIHDNLRHTGLEAGSQVMRTDSFRYLQRPPREAFDVIYVAPPQYRGLWKQALLALDRQPEWLNPDGIVVLQIDPKEKENVDLQHLEAYDERTYGNTLVWFFERPGE